ncbi:MAG: hypothetical protein IJD95_02970 [Clostridia bacterium]|nr:hypothetical protein [Clostridia bacterium]
MIKKIMVLLVAVICLVTVPFSIVTYADGDTTTVYFDNTETKWEYAVVLYKESAEAAWESLGDITAFTDDNIITVELPADATIIRIINYLPGQPESDAPEGGFKKTEDFEVVAGKTYRYEEPAESVGGGNINEDTFPWYFLIPVAVAVVIASAVVAVAVKKNKKQ